MPQYERSSTKYPLGKLSMLKAFYPRITLMSPFSPQPWPKEFLTIQYLVLSFGSTPQPMMAEVRLNSSI